MHRSALTFTQDGIKKWINTRGRREFILPSNIIARMPNYAEFLMNFFCMISSLQHLDLEDTHSKKLNFVSLQRNSSYYFIYFFKLLT